MLDHLVDVGIEDQRPRLRRDPHPAHGTLVLVLAPFLRELEKEIKRIQTNEDAIFLSIHNGPTRCHTGVRYGI